MNDSPIYLLDVTADVPPDYKRTVHVVELARIGIADGRSFVVDVKNGDTWWCATRDLRGVESQ